MRRAIAVVLSLSLPGLGHLVLGRRLRGALWFAATLLLMFAAHLWAWMWLAAIVMRIPAAIDAGWSGPSPSRRGPAQTLFEVAGGVLIAGMILVPIRIFCFGAFRISASSMAPMLELGDHVVIDKLAYRLAAPAAGEVAVFVNPCEPAKDLTKRIVAIAGDTVEVRCDVLFINGVAVQAHHDGASCSYHDRDELTGKTFDQACSRYVETLGGVAYALYYPADRPARDAAGDASTAFDFPPVDQLPGCPDDPPPSLGTLAPARTPSFSGACTPRQHYVVPADHVFVLGDNRASSFDSRVWGPVPLSNLKGRVLGTFWPLGSL